MVAAWATASACATATWVTVRAAIDVLASCPAPTVLVLGDMGEVGSKGPEFHREVGAYAREKGVSSLLALGEATRSDPRVELGASPRAVLMLFRAAKALAALEARDHVLPDDVQALAPSVLAHRLLLAPDAADGDAEAVIGEGAGGGADDARLPVVRVRPIAR